MRNMAELVAKFAKLDFKTSRKRLVAEEKPQGPTDAEVEADAIENLGRYPECETLIQSLRNRLDMLEVRMMEAIGDTPLMCMAQGAKQEVRSIIAQLEGKEK